MSREAPEHYPGDDVHAHADEDIQGEDAPNATDPESDLDPEGPTSEPA